MHALLSAAGRSFLRAFVASILVFAPGVLSAPNLDQMYLLGVAAVVAAVAAGIRSIQVYIPALTISKYLGAPYGVWADSALRAFLGSLVVTLPGVLNAPDLDTARSLGLAALVGAVTAAVRALQGLLTTGEHPAPASGIASPAG